MKIIPKTVTKIRLLGLVTGLAVMVLALPAYSYDKESYHDIPFGKLSANAIKRVTHLFGELPPGRSRYCAFDGELYGIFSFNNNAKFPPATFDAITLTTIKPKNDCQTTLQDRLPSFEGIEPGMYSFEVIKALLGKRYTKYHVAKGSAIIRKEIFDKAKCYQEKATEHFPAHSYYGANRTRLEYTLTNVEKSVVKSLMKSVDYGFAEEVNMECKAR